jgi:hypothetical protein
VVTVTFCFYLFREAIDVFIGLFGRSPQHTMICIKPNKHNSFLDVANPSMWGPVVLCSLPELTLAPDTFALFAKVQKIPTIIFYNKICTCTGSLEVLQYHCTMYVGINTSLLSTSVPSQTNNTRHTTHTTRRGQTGNWYT